MQRSAEPTDSTVPQSERRRRLRFELVFASAWLAFGLFALPAAIFFVGQALLGAYGEDGGLGRFYADFYRDLAKPSGRAWALALGPVMLVSMARLIFIGTGAPTENEPARPEPPSAPPPTRQRTAPRADPRRIEPRIGAEESPDPDDSRVRT